MYNKKLTYGLLEALAILGFSFIFTYLNFGSLNIIDPNYIGWLIYGHSDPVTYFLGWNYFYHGDWTWPVINLPNYIYQMDNSLTYTDSIPLLAVFLKLILPEHLSMIQPYGTWLLLCAILQGFFALKIAKYFGLPKIAQITLVALLIFNPVFALRKVHFALYSHWILLALIYYSLTLKVKKFSLINNCFWYVFPSICLFVHPYFLAKCLVFMVCHQLSEATKSDLLNTSYLIKTFSRIIQVLAIYVLLAFELSKPEDNKDHWNVAYTSDLFTLFDSQNRSYFFPSNSMSANWEGFNFIGFSGIIFLLYFLYSLRKNSSISLKLMAKGFLSKPQNKTIVAASLILFLWSLGPNIRALGHSIVKIDTLYNFLEPIKMFRSTGRFCWAMQYLVVILLFVFFWKKQKNIKKMVLTSVTLIFLQMIDLSPIYNTQELPEGNPTLKLEGPQWLEIAQTFKKIDLVPASYYSNPCGNKLERLDLYRLILFASLHSMKINSGYRAHTAIYRAFKYCNDQHANFLAGNLERDTVYVLDDIAFAFYSNKLSDEVNCFKLEKYYICHKKYLSY